MSKIHKGKRKQTMQLAKKGEPPAAVQHRQALAAAPVVPRKPIVSEQPVAHEADSPFHLWMRLPFVMIEAWLAPFQRNSETR